MTTRTVFKIFGSLGPAGSLVTLTEKFCRGFFTDAYELGDPAQFHTVEEDELKKLRSEFVNELFNFKGEFERKTVSLKPGAKDEAYQRLGQIYSNSRSKMIKAEKQRLTKERLWFYNEGDMLKYTASAKKLDLVEGDVSDNLQKMIMNILKPSLEEMRRHGFD